MKNGVSQTLTISAKAVQGLIQMNQPGSRENPAKDKGFIKALLISLCTLKKIQSMDENQKIENGILGFIKGKYFVFGCLFLFNDFPLNQNFTFSDLFIIRIGSTDDDDGTRYLRFNDLLKTARKEMKEYNFRF